MRKATTKRIEAIEANSSVHVKSISQIIYRVGFSTFNFWDIDSVTVGSLITQEEVTIQRVGNFKDYQTFIDLERSAEELIHTDQFGNLVLMCFNLPDGIEELSDGDIPDDAINMHLSDYHDTGAIAPIPTVYIPHNGRDALN